MNPIGVLPPGISDGGSPRLLIINNMPAYYRTAPFNALLTQYSKSTGGVGLVAYQVRRDSHGRGEWFFTPDSEFPYKPYFSAADTTRKRGRTGYPMKLDVALWREFRPDHVFTAGWDSPLSLSAAAYSRVTGARLGVWVESNLTTSRHRGGPADMARRAFLRSAEFAVVPTRTSASYVRALAGRDLSCVRLKNPVTWARLADDSGTQSPKRLVFLGDLSERKGFDYFASAVAAGASRGWSGVAYGRDVEGRASVSPSNLVVEPAKPLADIVPSLLPTDILVIPSRVDPAPLTFSEGLALGLRIIVSNRIAYGEDAHGVEGTSQVDPADSAAIIASAEKLMVGARPDAARGAEVTADRFAAGVIGAFRL
jgi:glycosyltransferase involved in cell wall biosynthesis